MLHDNINQPRRMFWGSFRETFRGVRDLEARNKRWLNLCLESMDKNEYVLAFNAL